MKQKEINNKLGQGISALISNKNNIQFDNNINNNDIVSEIQIDKIIAGKYQPRTNFDNDEIKNLSQSIIENKLIQPIIVRKLRDQDKYEIIAGERRFRAAKLAGQNQISAIIKKINDKQALEMSIVENIQRKDLSVIEEAKAYKRMADEFDYNQENIAQKVGKSRSHITNLIRLLLLPIEVQNMVNDNLISMGHARTLINVENAHEIANEILQKSLNVREVEDIIRYKKNYNNKKKNIEKQNSDEFTNQCKIISTKYQIKAEINLGKNKKVGKLVIKFDDKAKINNIINILLNNESQ